VGTAISGEIRFDLPHGTYEVATFDPKTGLYSPALNVHGQADVSLMLMPFVHDTVIRIRRVTDGD
jgi:hypothetical protein